MNLSNASLIPTTSLVLALSPLACEAEPPAEDSPSLAPPGTVVAESGEARALAHLPAPSPVTDVSVARAALDELRFDPGVQADDLHVSVVDGVLTLSGTVPFHAARARAVEVVSALKGVQVVREELEVALEEPVSDAALYRDVALALAEHPATEPFDVDVDVSDGELLISGTVESWPEEELVGRVAGSVAGVRDVVLDLEVQPAEVRADDDMAAEVEGLLEWDPRVEEALIGVELREGTVYLEGVVGSLAEERRVRSLAWVAGVQDVDASGLSVRDWARDPHLRTPSAGDPPPERLVPALETALTLDPEIRGDQIDVDLVGRTLVLRGNVPSLAARERAEALAVGSVGTYAVSNALLLRDAVEDGDERLELVLERSLARDAWLAELPLHVSVEDGVATLRGAVPDAFTWQRVDQVASSVVGLQQLRNELEIRDTGTESTEIGLREEPEARVAWFAPGGWADLSSDRYADALLTVHIERSLFYHPRIDSLDVVVEVRDGVALLRGELPTEGARELAEARALAAGADLVVNQISVRPPANQTPERP